MMKRQRHPEIQGTSDVILGARSSASKHKTTSASLPGGVPAPAAIAFASVPSALGQLRRRNPYVSPEHLGLESVCFGAQDEVTLGKAERLHLERDPPKNPFLEERDEAKERLEMKRFVTHNEKYLRKKMDDFHRFSNHTNLLVKMEKPQKLYEDQLFFSETAHKKHLRFQNAMANPVAFCNSNVPGITRSAPDLMPSSQLRNRVDSGNTTTSWDFTPTSKTSTMVAHQRPSTVPCKEQVKMLETMRKKLVSSQRRLQSNSAGMAIPGAPGDPQGPTSPKAHGASSRSSGPNRSAVT